MPTTVPTKDAPEVLSDDMRVSDLIEILEQLPFPRQTTRGRPAGPTHCLISLDRGVRDYLIAAIKPRSR
jgi:hypothetical protein